MTLMFYMTTKFRVTAYNRYYVLIAVSILGVNCDELSKNGWYT